MDTSNAFLITTMIMALGAITFSAITMAFDRSHQRKDVRPFCNINQNITNTEIQICIENAGMGPMLIHNILLLKNHDDPIETGVPPTKEMFSKFDCDVFVPNAQIHVLSPCSKLTLLQSHTDISQNGAMTLLKDELNGCCLYVKYADIYDDIYEAKAILTF